MKSLKGVLSAALAAVMVLSMAACSSTDAGSSTGVKDTVNAQESTGGETQAEGGVTLPLKETMEFTCLAVLSGEYDLADNIAMQTAMQNANINIAFNSVQGVDLQEKRNLILASGEYPDMLYKSGIGMADLSKYGSQGIFIPLEDLIREYAPNLTALLDKRDGWAYITSPDGHIYSLPEIDNQSGSMIPCWINKKWMDKLGLKEPASYEELYEVLKAFKEQDANGNGDPDDEIPLISTDICSIELLMAYEDFAYDQVTKTAVVDGELTYIPTDERYKKFLQYINKLYQEGILYKDSFTQAHEQQGAIGQTNDVLGCFFEYGAFNSVGRDNDDDYITLKPFQDGTYPLNTGIFSGGMAITDKCRNPEVLIAWADQFYSEEGGRLVWLGVEGKTYQFNEKDEWEWMLGNGYGDEVTTLRSSNTLQGFTYHVGVLPDCWFGNMSSSTDPDEAYMASELTKLTANGVVPLPMMNYSDGQTKEIASLKTDIDAYIQQYTAQVAIGELDLDSSWDGYIETMNKMGAEKLEEIYKTVYEAAGK